jgi:hypothetical protein
MQLMLRCAKVSKSGFYEWKDRGPSETSRRRAKLGRLIIALRGLRWDLRLPQDPR